MSVYFDACVLVPIFVREATSDRVNAFLDSQSHPVHVSDLGIAEVASTLSRRVREGRDTLIVARETLAAFDAWILDATIRLPVEPTDIRRAGIIVRRFDLKLLTPDAIHAALCERLGLTLVTLDGRLGDAAARLGIAVVVPT